MHGYGVEWSSEAALYHNSQSALTWYHNATWARSEISEKRFFGDAAVGKQLPYVPEFNIKEYVGFGWQNWETSLRYQWVSTRFTNEDHLRSLDPYHLWSWEASYRVKWNRPSMKSFMKQGSIVVRVAIKNLLNNRYQVVEYYPMPGRYIRGTIQLKL
jgi:iron complex outermembrane receptor protein